MIRDLELSILEILFNDARTTPAQIAVMTGHSEDEVTAVIRSLEAQKIILKYTTMINWDRVEADQVEAVIEVRVTPQRDEGFDAIAERITGYPEVRSVYLMSGGYDLMVRIEGNNLKNVAMFVARHLSTIDGVISTATHFLLKSYKRDGVVLVDKKGDKRQAVTL